MNKLKLLTILLISTITIQAQSARITDPTMLVDSIKQMKTSGEQFSEATNRAQNLAQQVTSIGDPGTWANLAGSAIKPIQNEISSSVSNSLTGTKKTAEQSKSGKTGSNENSFKESGQVMSDLKTNFQIKGDSSTVTREKIHEVRENYANTHQNAGIYGLATALVNQMIAARALQASGKNNMGLEQITKQSMDKSKDEGSAIASNTSTNMNVAIVYNQLLQSASYSNMLNGMKTMEQAGAATQQMDSPIGGGILPAIAGGL